MSAQLDSLHLGFDDPVHGSQQVFRQLLKAMSEPGSVEEVTCIDVDGSLIDAGFYKTSYAVGLSLLDSQTPIALSPSLDQTVVSNSLVFHCACPIFDLTGSETNQKSNKQQDKSEVEFLFLNAKEWKGLSKNKILSLGDLAYPERSTTIVVQVDAVDSDLLDQENTQKLSLSGPGIESTRDVYVAGLNGELICSIQENHNAFPLGYDFILAAPNAFLCLPRTCSVEVRKSSSNTLTKGA